MPRPATGQIIERPSRWGDRSYALRFRAYGERRFVPLGYASEGWSRRRAEVELANVLADFRRGLWMPADRRQPEPPPEAPTFHVFASEWVAGREAAGLAPSHGRVPAVGAERPPACPTSPPRT